MAEAAEVVMAEAEAVIAPAQQRERLLFVLAAASKPRCLLSPEAIVRYSAGIASRHKKAVVVELVAAVDADAAATIAAADAADVTRLPTNQRDLPQSRLLLRVGFVHL